MDVENQKAPRIRIDMTGSIQPVIDSPDAINKDRHNPSELKRSDTDDTERSSGTTASNSSVLSTSKLFFSFDWRILLAIFTPLFIFVTCITFLSIAFQNSNEDSNQAFDYLLDQTDPDETSVVASDTITAEFLSKSFTPMTISHSNSPSFLPSTAPSLRPTWLPWTTHDFQLRLYWEKGYFWQETYEETFWCMECANCDGYTRGDGWEADCESSGDSGKSCRAGDLIWIRRCTDNRDYKFLILKNFDSGDQVQVVGTNLCLSTVNKKYLEVQECDSSKAEQLWATIDDLSKFELRPYHMRDLSIKEARCLSQLHHPKSREVVGLHDCITTYHHDTMFWEEYHR